MPTSLQTELQAPPRPQRRYPGVWYAVAAGIAILIVVALVVVIRAVAPFGRASVTQQIEDGKSLRFEAGSFETSWIPAGFTAHDVRITDVQGGAVTPLLTAKTMMVKGSYLALLRKPRVMPELHLIGAVLTVPPNGSELLKRLQKSTSTNFTVIRIDDSRLNIPDKQKPEPLQFAVHYLMFRHLGAGGPVDYEIALTNPKPRGEVHATGRFGPWDSQHPFHTPVSGSFTYNNVDLSVDDGLKATLNSHGKFSGVLSAIDCSGSADLPRFEVDGTRHSLHLTSEFEAVVNAKNGDTQIKRAAVHFERTTVTVSGEVTGAEAGHGKKVLLSGSARDGRVEDLLWMFAHGEPGMAGAISFDAHVELPPAPPDFLTRLRLNGDFTMQGARFTKADTQRPIDELSGSAAGEKKSELQADPPHVVARVHGHVADADGVANLTNVQFEVPGVSGNLHGTFALHTKQINITGEIATTGQLSDTTNGMKSVLLKVVTPLWKKKAKERIVPFKLTGTDHNPNFSLQLHR